MKVAIIKDEQLDYCETPPFHPPEKYPEYPFNDTCDHNGCYGKVRELFYKLGMDLGHYGKASWDPLSEVIKPGDNVLIKPNFVSHRNRADSIEAIITHGSVIRAVVDYAYIALKARGSLTIGDASYIDTDFDKIVKITGIDRVASYYSNNGNIKINILDLRKEQGSIKLGRLKKAPLPGDPLGYSVVDLKKDSMHFASGDNGKFRNAYYNKHETAKHHNKERNEYYISNTVLNADVIINMPKLKTHGKTGISCSLKNLVGINGYKDWLPHHRAGSREEGGDEYRYKDTRKDLLVRIRDEIPSIDNPLYATPLMAFCGALFISKKVLPFRDPYEGGSWHGNETLPRTIADLNMIAFYVDTKGALRDTPQRKMFIVVDGITAGEKEGPMSNAAKKCGVLIAGDNPVEVDAVCSIVMGFDPEKIPTLKCAMDTEKYRLYAGDLTGIQIVSDKCEAFASVYDSYNCALVPPKGWVGHIEYKDRAIVTIPHALRISRSACDTSKGA